MNLSSSWFFFLVFSVMFILSTPYYFSNVNVASFVLSYLCSIPLYYASPYFLERVGFITILLIILIFMHFIGLASLPCLFSLLPFLFYSLVLLNGPIWILCFPLWVGSFFGCSRIMSLLLSFLISNQILFALSIETFGFTVSLYLIIFVLSIILNASYFFHLIFYTMLIAIVFITFCSRTSVLVFVVTWVVWNYSLISLPNIFSDLGILKPLNAIEQPPEGAGETYHQLFTILWLKQYLTSMQCGWVIQGPSSKFSSFSLLPLNLLLWQEILHLSAVTPGSDVLTFNISQFLTNCIRPAALSAPGFLLEGVPTIAGKLSLNYESNLSDLYITSSTYIPGCVRYSCSTGVNFYDAYVGFVNVSGNRYIFCYDMFVGACYVSPFKFPLPILSLASHFLDASRFNVWSTLPYDAPSVVFDLNNAEYLEENSLSSENISRCRLTRSGAIKWVELCVKHHSVELEGMTCISIDFDRR